MATMRLLNPPKVTNDAARAVKRAAGLTAQPVTTETLSQLLGLPGMTVTRFALEQQGAAEYLHLFCAHQHDVAVCPRCGTARTGGYDHQDRCVRHLAVWGKRTLVHFAQRRFDCAVCGQPFTENLAWLDPKRRQTRAYEAYIYQQVQQTSRKDVASQEGLHEATVLDIFKRAAQQATRQPRQRGVRILGVDEISLRKNHEQYALVLSDLERRCVIEVLPERTKEVFAQWLDSLAAAERSAIRVVSMDMWDPYRRVVRAKLPHAQIVADRFHVMKHLTHQIDLLRRALQKQADPARYELLKGNRWLLIKNRQDLKPEEEATLRQILAASEELRVLYLLKEEFRTICERIHDRAQAERFLQAWIWKAVLPGNRYLLRFVQTLRNWWAEFLNYFDDRVTQGFVEGINRAIRGIINRAFGFRNFDNFRLQVLVECGDP
jgi:transposase